ncbi:MAG: hypothetical protein BM556_13310 [Bacteriovorax sp. MedPE-SWde]|nr:MAG: hypothetical protein BM556_13310 [Bacteriovorax sp. MedPE-SWde]
MSAGDPVDKNSKIAYFNTRVIEAARTYIDRDKNYAIPALKGTSPLVYSSDYAVDPSNFTQVSVAGGKLTVSAMVDLFQFYAYNLTSIRSATMTRANTPIGYSNSGGDYADSPSSWTNIYSNTISALNDSYRMNIATFRSYVAGGGSYGTDVLTPFTSGNVATEADVNALIERLRAIVIDHMTSSTVAIQVCHSACHDNCHSSRGRR